MNKHKLSLENFPEGLRNYAKSIQDIQSLSKKEELALWKKIRLWDRQAKEKVIKAYLHLVVPIVEKYLEKNLWIDNLEKEDLIQIWNEFLIKAVDEFKAENQTRFSKYAKGYIEWGMKNIIAQYNIWLKVEYTISYVDSIIENEGLCDEEYFEDNADSVENPERYSDLILLFGKIYSAFESLKPEEKIVLKTRLTKGNEKAGYRKMSKLTWISCWKVSIMEYRAIGKIIKHVRGQLENSSNFSINSIEEAAWLEEIRLIKWFLYPEDMRIANQW